MKKLLELLKSLKDWQKAGVIITFLGLLLAVIESETLKGWVSPTPESELYLGKYKLEEGKKIIMHYMIPSNPNDSLYHIIPFPLIIANNTDKDIRHFSLKIEVETKKIYKDGMNGFISRAFVSENSFHLKSNKPDEEIDTQMILNTGDNKVLYAGFEVKDLLTFHLKKDSCFWGKKGFWESFPITITTSSENGTKEDYYIEIRLYNADNEQEVLKYVTDNKNMKMVNIVVRTLIDYYAKDEKGKVWGMTLKVSRKENALQMIE